MVDLLVVDNDARIAELVAWFLQRGGHQPRVVTSYAAAREVLREQDFALMLADLELGVEDGRVELPLLEAVGILPPTLVVSGYLDAEITAALLEISHVLGTVAKPFEPSELLARVDEVLARENTEDTRSVPVAAVRPEAEMTIPTPPVDVSATSESGALAEEEEVLREVLIEPQPAPTPTIDQGAGEVVPDEDGWIEIKSEGFGGRSTLESGE